MKIKSLLLVIGIALAITGCSSTTRANCKSSNADQYATSMFVIVEKTSLWGIVYHKDTKVMYAVSYGSYNCGTFTLLVDENGDPLLYEE